MTLNGIYSNSASTFNQELIRMSRPRKDGTAPREPNRRNLTELFVRKVMTEATPINVWDEKERGLVLRVHPTGRRAFKVVYSRRGRPRWYHIGDVALADARRMAARIKLAVAEGKDPAAERKAEGGAGTFADLPRSTFGTRRSAAWCCAFIPRGGERSRSCTRAAAGRGGTTSAMSRSLTRGAWRPGSSSRSPRARIRRPSARRSAVRVRSRSWPIGTSRNTPRRTTRAGGTPATS